MFCSRCGRELPDGDPDLNFCPKCGKALRGDSAVAEAGHLRWEYRDDVIPMNVELRLGSPFLDWRKINDDDCRALLATVDQALMAHLREVGCEGWEPMPPFRASSTYVPDSVPEADTQKHGLFGPRTYTYKGLTIRLRRLVRATLEPTKPSPKAEP